MGDLAVITCKEDIVVFHLNQAWSISLADFVVYLFLTM
jgi:hypothetical protein